MSPKRSRQSNLIPIGGIIKELVSSIRPLRDQQMMEIWDLWGQVIDSSIAANAKPAAFRGGTLIVHVSGSAWIQHLRFMEKQIVDKLNQAYGSILVERISFKIGKMG